MVDVEFRIVASRREGLLISLGQLVIANGFHLLRHRIGMGADGVVLSMTVRGPENGLLQLEEHVGTHSMVLSFEACPAETGPAASATPVAVEPAPPTPATPPPTPATAARAAQTGAVAPIDHDRVERLLPQLARSYPNFFLFLHALEHELAPEQREPTMLYIGQRVGAWIYKRDYALGARLPPAQALRHIGVPALRQLVQVEARGDVLHIANSPFPHRGRPGTCCHFLRGVLGGLLGAAQAGDAVRIVEIRCRNAGADTCAFECQA